MPAIHLIKFLLIATLFYACQPTREKGLLDDPLLRQAQERGTLRISPLELSPEEREAVRLAVENANQTYNPEVQMYKSEFSSPGYHTTLKEGEVHRTRGSIRRAVALLDTYDETLRERAIRVIDKVISLQETDPENDYFGIWPWFLEEPIAQMAPPDRNWADFCGSQLLEITLTHRHRLPDSLNQKIDQAIQNAARAIQQRDVGPGYTNIAIMGTFVTFAASELYSLEEMNRYARRRMQRFYDFTLEHQGFTEYNSPTYTRVAMDELSRMRRYIQDEEMRRLIDEVYRMGWGLIADHFHAPTRMLAGPHSRTYHTADQERFRKLIQEASGGKIQFSDYEVDFYDPRLSHEIPLDLISRFTQLEEKREVKSLFRNDQPPIYGTTYLSPDFALGSVNRSSFWNQRRNLLAYWGSPEDVSFVNLRFLHDGYDFSAVQFFSQQQENKVLVATNFATNGGDTHISLDRLEEGKFEAKQLALRFELGNVEIEEASLPKNYNEAFRVDLGKLSMSLEVPYLIFEAAKPYWKISREEDMTYLDLVIYEGEKRAFDLSKMQAAGFALGFALEKEAQTKPQVKYYSEAGTLQLDWQDMQLSIPLKPAIEEDLQKAVVSSKVL
jgi:hypothetical protein